MKKRCFLWILVLFSFFIHAERVAILPDLIEPSVLKIDGANIYIVDGARILIYSREDLHLIKKIGRGGEGPGEFKPYHGGRQRLYIDVQSDQIWVSSNEKLTVFDKNFKFIEDHKMPAQIGYNNKVGNYMVSSNYFWEKNPTTTEQIILFKRKGKDYAYTKTIYKTRTGGGRLKGLNPGKKNDYQMISHNFDVQVWKDKIFIGDTSKGFFFTVFDQQGNMLYEIKKQVEKIPVTEKDKQYAFNLFKSERFWKQYKHLINPVYPEFFPSFKKFIVINNRIYVFTHKSVDQAGEVLILDLKGSEIGRGEVPLKKYFSVFNNKYYYLNKNDDQEWELFVESLVPERKNDQ